MSFFLDSVCEIIEARTIELDIELHVIEGISSLDTIIHQLRIPLTNLSISVFVADYFCTNRPTLNENTILVLFQPGNVNSDRITLGEVPETCVKELKATLLQYYSPKDKWLLINLSNSPKSPTKIIWNTVENIDNFINYMHSGTLLLSKNWWPELLEGSLPTIVDGK